MHVPSLGNALARLFNIDQFIAFNNRDSFEMLLEHTICQQSGHTPTNHDSMMPIESLLLFYRILFHTCYSF